MWTSGRSYPQLKLPHVKKTGCSELLHDVSEIGDASHLPAGNGTARRQDIRNDEAGAEQGVISIR